eukprot:TRINITY_DN10239_c0_g1_i2.p1 TRINITY_DN10239_c0_g1~~TRINITY_DN10239_c0_g1_i2.p1  ORF type:complete len:152 (+),score=22.96 TRINITY_DN10239_c0_g1_i2:32-457(+)
METEDDFEVETEVSSWMNNQLDVELKRIKSMQSNAIPLPVKNMGIIREKKGNKELVINRLEINTSFDFDKIVQLMISDSTPCPMKKDFSYVNVVLFADKPLPLIVPYLYLVDKQNELKEWLFINNSLQRTRRRIDDFEVLK